MNYDLNHFRLYCNLVITEMEKRGYNVSDKTKAKLCQYLKGRISVSSTFGGQLSVLINNEYEPLFGNWHTDRYLAQCLYNLEENMIEVELHKQNGIRFIINILN